ncbi:MAG TPA: GNAT family N-acetyltransferase [Candidatus Nanoarchaeia archaeon]|nr:GNAT family N-acetyltransferase [Candidatus Nanoarchaeia archaeon]
MSSLIIRKATIEDIPSIVKVRLNALTDKEIQGYSALELPVTASAEKLRESWSRGNRLKDDLEVFIAEDRGMLIGYMMCNVDADAGYIDDLVVAKEKQGMGIGKALVGYIEDAARSKGCSVMKTDTTENVNGVPWRSYEFWIKMGYEDFGERLPTNYGFKIIPLVKKLK